MKDKLSLRKEVIQWTLAVVLTLAGLAVWRLGTSPATAQEFSLMEATDSCE